MRAIFGAAVQIAVQPVGRRRDAVEHLVRKTLLQRFLERGGAEHAVRARAGDRDTHVRRTPGDEHADQRVTRSLVAELDVGRLLRQREHHLGDDLVALERCREQALKKFFRLEAALVGDDGGAERKHGCGIIRGRVVVGERAADGALVAHRGIADSAGEFGQRRNSFADDRRRRDVGMPGGRADHQRTALHLDGVEPFDMGEVDQMRRAGKALLHDRHQRMAAGDHLGVFVLHQQIGGLPHGRRTMIFEFVH